jgi:hypothetical protein
MWVIIEDIEDTMRFLENKEERRYKVEARTVINDPAWAILQMGNKADIQDFWDKLKIRNDYLLNID